MHKDGNASLLVIEISGRGLRLKLQVEHLRLKASSEKSLETSLSPLTHRFLSPTKDLLASFQDKRISHVSLPQTIRQASRRLFDNHANVA